MSDALREITVLALDCQAGGATPAHGDLLELGWAVCTGLEQPGPVSSHFVVPRTERRVPRPIRELTGWSEACVQSALEDRAVWRALCDQLARLSLRPAPTVIHFARFELGFLTELHARTGESVEFPLDAICLHAVALRLFPELPRKNIRALAGFLGHSTELCRRSAGHVEATAFIWRALVPRLEEQGVRSWCELKAWLESTPSIAHRVRRKFPLAVEIRRRLPDAPGVYRFLRSNGDVLYVGKATSLKKRVASHFTGAGRLHERGLELLTQVHDIQHTETASILESALLETDEIKRIDPPYNVQLRSGDGCAWFASRDFEDAVAEPDAAHPIGPLPSRGALMALPALIALADGAAPSPSLQARALGVSTAFLPEAALFAEGWQSFERERLTDTKRCAARRVCGAARALWLERGRAEPEPTSDDRAPDHWDLARVLRRLERNLVQAGLLVRRARWLRLLADATLAFREQDRAARALIISRGKIVETFDISDVSAIAQLPDRRCSPLGARSACFDRAAYDRMRVLATELRRVHDDGGDAAIRLGAHLYVGERLARLLGEV